jgi:hypothetical protein
LGGSDEQDFWNHARDSLSAGLCSQGMARAGEVKLLSALVMKPALAELAAGFERTSGHKLTIAYDSAGAVTKRIHSGGPADVVIIQKTDHREAYQTGKDSFRQQCHSRALGRGRGGSPRRAQDEHRFGRRTHANVAGS